MISLSNQFIIILNKLNVSGYRAALDLGVSQTTIANIKKGGNPSTELLLSIITVYGINANWLLFGQGEMLALDEMKRLGIEEDDLSEVPRENLKLKVDHTNKKIALAEDPASYETETTLHLAIKVKGNKVISVNNIPVSDSDASPDKNKAAIKELTKLVTSNMPSSKK